MGLAGLLYIQSMSGSPWSCARWQCWWLGFSLNCPEGGPLSCSPSPTAARLHTLHTLPPPRLCSPFQQVQLRMKQGPLSELAPLSPNPHCSTGDGQAGHMVSTGNVLRAHVYQPQLRPTSCSPAPLGRPLPASASAALSYKSPSPGSQEDFRA